MINASGTRRSFLRHAAAAAAVVGVPMGTVRAQTVLKLATALPPGSSVYKSFEWWVKAVNDAGQGEVQLQPMHGYAYASPANVYERTVNGVADVGFVLLAATGKPFPRTSVSQLPGTGDDGEAISVALWRLYAKGLLADEFNEVKLINIQATPVNGLLAKEPVRKMADLRGQKVRVIDKITGDAMAALGGTPLSVPYSEAYQAISRGVMTASIANPYAVSAFKLGEVAKHFTDSVSFGTAPLVTLMNKQSYERLSPRGRAVIDRFSGEESSRTAGRAHIENAAGMVNDLKSRGELTVHALPADEVAAWQKALQPVAASWAAATPDGRKVLDAYLAEYASAKSQKK
ncbi:MAG TPA: TRAP transporter substrate-binding protein [Ramlibacter sp.]|jgi:TRAP-type C4-dicarboxylate transport system substrate-binding protein